MAKPIQVGDICFDWCWGDGLYGLIVTTPRRQFLIGFDLRAGKGAR